MKPTLGEGNCGILTKCTYMLELWLERTEQVSLDKELVGNYSQRWLMRTRQNSTQYYPKKKAYSHPRPKEILIMGE